MSVTFFFKQVQTTGKSLKKQNMFSDLPNPDIFKIRIRLGRLRVLLQINIQLDPDKVFKLGTDTWIGR